ncbi:MAG: glycine oxidase ThiO [Candidatus Acidiferrum sp.]
MKRFDVAIAGGGLIGGALALELARAGLKVGLFEAQELGREASWAGAGILSPAPENTSMLPMVALGQASMALYPAFVREVEELSGQSVGFRPKGTLETFSSRHAVEELSTIVALHHGLGLRAEPLSGEDARKLEPAIREDVEAAVLRPEEGSVDNRALTPAVMAAARRSGVEIFADAAVKALRREGSRCVGLSLKKEAVDAKFTVIAAGCFSTEIQGAAPYAPVRPAKGQMVALRAAGVSLERVVWSENVYLVPRNDGRILAGATVEYVGFERTPTAGGLAKLLAAAIEVVPGLAGAKIEEHWAGLRPDTPDHLPILGPTDLEGLLMATGHFRSGILLAPITAVAMREWITLERVSVDWGRFSPMRFAGAGRAAKN